MEEMKNALALQLFHVAQFARSIYLDVLILQRIRLKHALVIDSY